MLGDVILLEMWLEPKYYAYGLSYFSGRIILGSTRSNENLVNATDVTKIFDTRRLDFGIRVGAPPNIQEIIASKINESGPRWTDDFHTYTTFWTGDGFTFLVDGQKIGQINHDPHGWLHDVDRKAAPFDQEVKSAATIIRYEELPRNKLISSFKSLFSHTQY